MIEQERTVKKFEITESSWSITYTKCPAKLITYWSSVAESDSEYDTVSAV